MSAEGKLVQYEDVSRQLALETENSLHKQVQKATLDTLEEGVAIFGTDGRLVLGNSCFATQWQLSESAMLRHPHYSEIAAGSTAAPGTGRHLGRGGARGDRRGGGFDTDDRACCSGAMGAVSF